MAQDTGALETDPEGAFLLLTPTHRMASVQMMFSVERAHWEGLPFMWKPHAGDALIGRARSIEATFVLDESPWNYAIFLDSDIAFDSQDLAKIFGHLKAGYDLIGGLYVVRDGSQLAHYGTGPNGGVRLDGSIQQVDYLSTGFMGFSKRLLRKIVDELKLPLCHPDNPKIRAYPFFESGSHYYEREQQWIYRSEDWDFCDKARRVGVLPYVDASVQLGHEGFKTWTLKDLPAARLTPVAPEAVRPSGLVLPNQLNRAARRHGTSPVAALGRRR